MAWAFIAESWVATAGVNQNHFGASATLTPGIPAGLSDGDMMLCFASLRENAGTTDITMPAGWTPLFATQRHPSGENSIRAFYRRFVTGDTAPTVTFAGGGTGDTTLAVIVGFSGGLAAGDPLDVLGTFSTNASAVNVGPITGVTPTVDDALVIVFAHKAEATATGAADYSTLTGDGLTWAEATDRGSLAGSDSSQVAGYAIIAGSPVAVGNKTFTHAGTTEAGCGIMFSLKPEPAAVGDRVPYVNRMPPLIAQ
jgi:hypothetical protein